MTPFITAAGKKGSVQHWASLGALSRHFETRTGLHYLRSAHYGTDACDDGETAARRILLGDSKGAAEAKAQVDKIALAVASDRPVWTPAVAGSRADVPAYLVGSPLAMRRRVKVKSERAPLKIWLGLTCSQGTSQRALRQRAIGAMALALALSGQRQVTVIGFAGMGGARGGKSNFITVPLPVDTDMAGVFTALAHPIVCRFAAFNVHRDHGGDDYIPWPWDQHPTTSEAGDPSLNPNVRDAIGCGPNDVLLNGAHLDDDDLIVRDPLAWVRKMLAKHGAVPDQEAA
jgi:hypothetical protein